ncbi:NaeI family type II restriction endonuclease [Solirubrobacter soli]|uniref:NaeI family type II restriction endonuclease n=1 Tax=Solirubrobacter soli TaxID=363832 RepID=UPI0003FE3601|nr:NaeI family type II restriction endonuclease [Solirubrobacter soli]
MTDYIVTADPHGERLGDVLRDTYDQLLDGQATGRWDWLTLRKTEKTHMGTLVEINLHREFDFGDGDKMDYCIDGAEVDCKFSQSLGGWEMPPESVGHLCLVVWASDDLSRWEAGLIRVHEGFLRPGGNRDAKRRLTDEGESRVRWLYDRPPLPENLLLHLTDEARERIFSAGSGQQRINELFRSVTGRIIRRAVILTVAMQDDSLKRARDARLPRHLGREGYLVLGHQEQDPLVAAALGLPVPRKGEFISARVTPHDGLPGPGVAEINGNLWRVAGPDDTPPAAPQLVRVARRDAR